MLFNNVRLIQSQHCHTRIDYEFTNLCTCSVRILFALFTLHLVVRELSLSATSGLARRVKHRGRQLGYRHSRTAKAGTT
jgi:hypothetical protein